MNFRTTIILFVLLIGLGLFAYFYEYKGGEEREKKKEQEKILLEVKKEDVSEINLSGTDKPIKIISAGEDSWKITSPSNMRADSTTVDRILGSFENLKYQQIVEEQPKDLAQYGLDKPKASVDLVLKKGNARKSIQVGAKNPVDNACYIRINNDPRVYLVDGSVGDVAKTTLFDLRDKKLTDFVSEKVVDLKLHTAASDFEFKKDNGVWKMEKPVSSPASDNEISSFLSALEFLRATRFIDQPSADLTEYGLKDPSATVDIVQEKGLEQKINFGKKDGDQLYAQVQGGSIASVSDSFSTYFSKKLEDWREKKLVIFNRFDATEAVIKTGGKEYHLKKGSEDKWTQESPTKGSVDGEKVQSLLENLETAEIRKYADKPGITGTAPLEIVVNLKDWQDKITKKHLVFGQVEGNQQLIQNDDYNVAVWSDASIENAIEKALNDLQPKKK